MDFKKNLSTTPLVFLAITALGVILTLFLYAQSKQTELEKSSIEELISHKETVLQDAALEFSKNLNRTESSITRFSSTLSRALKASEQNVETQFNQLTRLLEDGSIRSHKNGFNSSSQAGIFLPNFFELKEANKKTIVSARRAVENFGQGAFEEAFQNTWFMPKEGGIVLYWPANETFIFDIDSDYDYRNTDWVVPTLPEHNPQRLTYWTQLLFDIPSQMWMISAVAPVYVDNQWVGAVGHDIPMNHLLSNSLFLKVLPDSHFIVVSDDLKVIASDQYTEEIKSSRGNLYANNLPDPSWHQMIMKASVEGIFRKKHLSVQTDSDLYHITHLNKQNWLLISNIPISPIKAQVSDAYSQLRKAGFISILLEFLIAAGILFWSHRRNSNQLQKITDLHSKLSHFNEALEEKVETRTKELKFLNRVLQQKNQQISESKENELQEILDSMVDAVISFDQYGRILSFNKAAETIFGYNAKEVLNKNVITLLSEKIPPMLSDYFYLKNNELNFKSNNWSQKLLGSEAEAIKKNGDFFPVRLNIAKLPSNEKNTERYVASCIDLTNLKQQEENLRRTQKMNALGKLTGGIAHDYNNLLGIIMGYAEMLQLKLVDQPKVARFAQQIYLAGERGANLTDKLLSFSKKRRAKSSIENINKIIEQEFDMLQRTLTVRVELVLELQKNVWPVLLDKNALIDAIVNLSINAMQATVDHADNPQLIIKTQNLELNDPQSKLLALPIGHYVKLSFSDNGEGMTKEVQNRIFDPFFTTKDEKGTGLGLSQVFGFIQSVHGGIKVDSTLEEGTTFELYFPKSEVHESLPSHSAPNTQTASSNKERILIVDDEPQLRLLAREILSSAGFVTEEAETASEAINKLSTQPFDIVLSDVVMPEIDGYRLAKMIKNRFPAVKIQLVSGYTKENSIKNPDDFLSQNLIKKPYKSKELINAIFKLLGDN